MKNNRNGERIRVLLVEDDPGDVDLTREVMKSSKLTVSMDVARDGVEALMYLRKEDGFSTAPTPDLILMDLNMPRKDGRETLEEIKSDDQLKYIPVVILTTSTAEEDVVRTYTAGASCYVAKPVDLDQFSRVVEALDNFWFTVVKFPRRD